MQFDTSYLTAAGREIATTELGGLDLIQYTKAVASSDDYSSLSADDLRKLTSLDGVEQTVSYSKILKKDATTLALRVDFPSADVKTAYELYTVGFYAKLKSGDEVLYAVLPSDTPDQISANDGKSNVNDSFTINSTVANTADVDFSLTAAGTLTESDLETILESKHYATTEYVNGKLTNYYTKAEVDAKFVTDDDFASKLPKNIATTDAANTFAKSQTLAGGATDGKGNAYATTKDVATDLNNGLSAKVTDNKNGTEQLNGVQVQPFNKLSDTIGGRNLLMGTSGTLQTVTNASGWYANFPQYVLVEPTVNSNTTYTARIWLSPVSHDMRITLSWKDSSGIRNYGNGSNISAGTSGYSTWTGTITAGSTINYIEPSFTVQQSTASTVSYKEMKFEKGTVATNWTPAPEDKQDKIAYTPADDSKVAHLSGANNFDTVPTVNNNPLLLASSLPSDLARTGQDANFTGKLQQNGQDVALANNTIDRNPDTGVVSKPTDFTNLTVNGGKSVATSDDLKSLETSAWRQLDLSGTSGLYKGKIYAKIDETSKRIYLMGDMYFSNQVRPSKGDTLLDLSSVATSLSSAHGYIFFINGKDESATQVDMRENAGNQASTLSCSGSKLTVGSGVSWNYAANHILFFPDAGMSAVYVTYSSLV